MGLTGSLAELPLADLLEMISLGGKTGLLQLTREDGEPVGELAFRDGRLAGAVCGKLVGERAFYALMELPHGDFDFDPAAELEDATCDLSIQSLLMEAARRLDETRRLREGLAASALVRVRGRKSEAEDELEAQVLAKRRKRPRPVSDVVNDLLAAGEAGEYDALLSLQRLLARGAISLDAPPDAAGTQDGAPAESTST